MSNFITQFGAWIGILTAVAVGAVALFGLVDKRKREVRSEENDTEDRLIKLFKEERDHLNKRVDEQNRLIGELEIKVDKMTHENEILIRVLQGKDDTTKKFQQEAYASMEKLNMLFELSKVSNENITKLITLIDRRFEVTKPTT